MNWENDRPTLRELNQPTGAYGQEAEKAIAKLLWIAWFWWVCFIGALLYILAN